jgi:hypothetical protein
MHEMKSGANSYVDYVSRLSLASRIEGPGNGLSIFGCSYHCWGSYRSVTPPRRPSMSVDGALEKRDTLR